MVIFYNVLSYFLVVFLVMKFYILYFMFLWSVVGIVRVVKIIIVSLIMFESYLYIFKILVSVLYERGYYIVFFFLEGRDIVLFNYYSF